MEHMHLDSATWLGFAAFQADNIEYAIPSCEKGILSFSSKSVPLLLAFEAIF